MSNVTFFYNFKNLVLYIEGAHERLDYRLSKEEGVKASQRLSLRKAHPSFPACEKTSLHLYQALYIEALEKVRASMYAGSSQALRLETEKGATEWVYRELAAIRQVYKLDLNAEPTDFAGSSYDLVEAHCLAKVLADVAERFALKAPKMAKVTKLAKVSPKPAPARKKA